MSEEITEVTEATEVKTEEIKSYIPSLIEKAIEKGLSVEHLEKLMILKERFDAIQAKKDFDEAMSIFQSKCPPIKKWKRGSVTSTGVIVSMYAPMETIINETKDLREKCGFSFILESPVTEKGINATCIIKHISGHSEKSSMELPFIRQTNSMSDAQVVAGTRTFAVRYAFCNAFGIVPEGEDNDGKDEITDVLKDEFKNKLMQFGKYTDKIISAVNTIETGSAYKDFLSKMPSKDDVDKFIKLIEPKILVNQDDEIKYWNMFQSAVVGLKWKEYLTALEKKK